MKPRNVLLLEFNEISWAVVDKLLAAHGPGYLPNFARLRSQGAWATQVADERPPHLDPWVTWVTVHTGVPQEVHHASVLEQETGTIGARRSWEHAVAAGRKVGIFGSIGAYPPQPVNGFMVPGPFAPGPETFPPSLEPVQKINRLGTQVQNRTGARLGIGELARLALQLPAHGLKSTTMFAIAAQLLRERMNPAMRWRRPALQPLVNFDIFARLYRRHQPDFATWHTNHAAHFMHHYWRAWDDSTFRAKSPPEERKRFGDAVPLGYRLCDRLLGRFIRLVGPQGVLVIASSMGQKPYQSERYQEGKIIVRIRDIERFLDVIGRDGIDEVVPTMVPQWNLTVPDPVKRAQLQQRIGAARRQVGDVFEPAIHVAENGQLLTISPYGLSAREQGVRYFFDGCPGAPAGGVAMETLFSQDAPTPKQGMHHPEGLLAFFGAGIAPGTHLGTCSNLDVAPTILSLLGIAIPPEMKGRPLLDTPMPEPVAASLGPAAFPSPLQGAS
jgi:hypothetical protein